MGYEIERKSSKFINELLKNHSLHLQTKCNPKGLLYIAVDNSTGNAWTEEFNTLAECWKYLLGELCTTRSGERID